MNACTHLAEMSPTAERVKERVPERCVFISLAPVQQQMMNNAVVSKPGSQEESKRAAKTQMCHEMTNSFFHGSCVHCSTSKYTCMSNAFCAITMKSHKIVLYSKHRLAPVKNVSVKIDAQTKNKIWITNKMSGALHVSVSHSVHLFN